MSVSGLRGSTLAAAEASYSCALCPRLSAFLAQQRDAEPSWFNGPVVSFGPTAARLLIVGLAPGLRGANRTGRPFTGDYAGNLLYATLAEFGFSSGTFGAHADDGLQLVDCMVTNAVRCVPPANKPTPSEVNTCRQFLTARIEALPELRAIACLGRVSHDSTLTALGARKSAFPFQHGARHEVRSGLTVFDSYHCSRYNTNTGVLTEPMFRAVFNQVRALLGSVSDHRSD